MVARRRCAKQDQPAISLEVFIIILYGAIICGPCELEKVPAGHDVQVRFEEPVSDIDEIICIMQPRRLSSGVGQFCLSAQNQ